MGIPRIDTGPMTVEEFYAFTDARPDEEKWELIDGEAVLNASPGELHQQILKNLLVALAPQERSGEAGWTIIPGIGALISQTSRPEPDAMILPNGDMRLAGSRRDTRLASVRFEIISPSTASRDLKWKRSAYANLDALMHYVVVAQDSVDILVFSRDGGFSERRFQSLTDVIALNPPGVSLPLADIYRNTGILSTSGQ
jgi:Uma2 family endonuclease